ncbi:hypothetical protein ACH4FE_35610 [Streptomyces celluloflavus]|uniref:hypothetical protein n=1 Tax=Streptomyces celluloflavus TaxID=58344 RepID=UPI0037951ABB
MKLSTLLDPLAESAVIAVCVLADAAGPERWSNGAVEDAATALEVLAEALPKLSPEAAELLQGHPGRAEDPVVLGTGPWRALAAHSLAGHRVHRSAPLC